MPGTLLHFDRRLYEQKLLEPSLRIGEETRRRWRQVHSEVDKRGNLAGLFPDLIDSALEILSTHLKDIDRICREVWRVQGKTESPEFIREVIRDYAVFGVIAARCATIKGDIILEGRRIRSTNLTAVLNHLHREKGQLENVISNRYEIEAHELELKGARLVTKAPPLPINGIGSGSNAPSNPKPTQVPENLPLYYPSALGPQTHVIIAEAVRKCPHQTKSLELCKYVISEMTPVFRAAVEAGTIRPEQVLSDSGMGGLLHSLLVYNCKYENERYRLGQEARKSDEWLTLAKAILETEQRRTQPTLEQHPGATIANIEPLGLVARKTREEFLRPMLKTKGLSVHGWARKANVDFHTADNYLKGKTKPNPDTLKSLADALGLKVEELPT